MTDKNRLHHLLDLAAKEIPDTVDLWPQIRDKATQRSLFNETMPKPAVQHPQSDQPTNPQRGRALSFSFAVACAVLILVGSVFLNGRVPLDHVEWPYGASSPATQRSETPGPSLQVVSQVGLGKAIEAVWSPDGRQMFVVTTRGIWIYDAADLRKPIENIYPELSFSQAPVFSYDSTYLAFLDGREAHLWDLVGRHDIIINLSRETTQPSSIALTFDARVLAVGDPHGNIHFYDVQTQTHLSSAQISDDAPAILEMKFNTHGALLALTEGRNPFVILQDLTGQWNGDYQYLAIPTDSQDESAVEAIAYSADGSHFVARFDDRLVVWEWDGQKLSTVSQIERIDNGGRLIMNRDGTQVANLSQLVSIWFLSQESSAHHMMTHDTSTEVMNLNADWSQISLVDPLGRLSVRDLDTDKELMSTDAYTMDRVKEIAFTSDGSKMVTDDELGQIRVWKTAMLTDVPAPFIVRQASATQPIAMPLERRLALPRVFGTEKKIELWDLTSAGSADLIERFDSIWPLPSEFMEGTYTPVSTPRPLVREEAATIPQDTTDLLMPALEPIMDLITAGAISPDAASVAVGLSADPAQSVAASVNPIIVLYAVDTGQEIIRLSGHDAPITSLVYSPDGTQLLSSGRNDVLKLWDLKMGNVLHEFPIHGAFPPAFSPDGTLIAGVDRTAAASGSDLVLWDASTGDLVLRIHDKTSIERVVFHPDGQHLVTGSSNGVITFWEVVR